jgi:hypothetical protein
MNPRNVFAISLLMVVLLLPAALAFGDDGTFYWYRDFNGDNKPDQRIVFAGDFTEDFVAQLEFDKAVECSTTFKSAWFTMIACFNNPPCPMEQPFCKQFARRIIAIQTAGNPPCHCVHAVGESPGPGNPSRTYVYVATDEETYRLLSMSSDEFEDFLMANFHVLETISLDPEEAGQKGLEDCDIGVIWTIDWRCDDLECPEVHTCVKNQTAVVTGIITVGAICACVESAPSLTTWGIIALVVLLIASAGFLMLRRKKAAVPA